MGKNSDKIFVGHIYDNKAQALKELNKRKKKKKGKGGDGYTDFNEIDVDFMF